MPKTESGCRQQQLSEKVMGQSTLQLLSVLSYSGVTGGKILQKYCYLLASCVTWGSQKGEGQTEAITVGSIQAQAPQEPFCATETDHGVWNLVGTGRTGWDDWSCYAHDAAAWGTSTAPLNFSEHEYPLFIAHFVCKYISSSRRDIYLRMREMNHGIIES